MNNLCFPVVDMIPVNKSVTVKIPKDNRYISGFNSVEMYKQENGRVWSTFDKPVQINVGGKKINDVLEYSTIKYTDGVTKKGRSFDIVTKDSYINAYTHDGKFYLMDQMLKNPAEIKIGDKVLKGQITKRTHADGSRLYTAIGKNLSIKKIVVAPNGQIVPVAKGKLQKMSEMIIKNTKMFLSILKF